MRFRKHLNRCLRRQIALHNLPGLNFGLIPENNSWPWPYNVGVQSRRRNSSPERARRAEALGLISIVVVILLVMLFRFGQTAPWSWR